MNISLCWAILFYGWIAGEFVIAVATRTKNRTGATRDRGTQLILWLVLVACVTACEFIRRLMVPNMFGGADWLKVASIVLLALGLCIRAAAVITLGKAFSANVAIRSAQQLNHTGFYGLVRHPSYLGSLIILAAIGLYTANWIGLAVALVPTTAAFLYRIEIEEAALKDAFGSEYAAYCKTTKRLIPGVY